MYLVGPIARLNHRLQDDNQYSSYYQFESKTLIQPVAYRHLDYQIDLA